jgi:hypothetical protein
MNINELFSSSSLSAFSAALRDPVFIAWTFLPAFAPCSGAAQTSAYGFPLRALRLCEISVFNPRRR